MSNSTPTEEFPNLSNEGSSESLLELVLHGAYTPPDVKLLFEIVTVAQNSSNPPYRALFAAYDQVLARYGIKPDHDQTYFRFLLRMGEGRKPGETLFDQFEALLAKSGIQVDIGEEEKREEEDSLQNEGPQLAENGSQVGLSAKDFHRPTRRASFDSIYDTNTAGRSALSGIRSASRTRSRSHDTMHDVLPKHISNLARKRNRGIVNNHSRQHHPRAMSQRGRSISDNHSGVAASRKHSNSKVSISKDRSSRYTRQASSADEHRIDYSENSVDASDKFSDITNTKPLDAPDQTLEKGQHAKYVLTYSQMMAGAETFKYRYAAGAAHRVFHEWHLKAQQSLISHMQMGQMAATQDSVTLLRQAFEQWCTSFHERRHLAETEKFFDLLEERARRARDLFLLTKAFTHWAQCTSDEVLRTSAARRHIIRTRYFNAWKDITVVNELKVRRLGLSKFLAIWKRRTSHVCGQDEEALECNAKHLAIKFYKQWFWLFCERRTPSWYASKIKISSFTRWFGLARQSKIKTSLAIEFMNLTLLCKALPLWSRRAGLVQQHHMQAIAFRRRKLLKTTTATLRKGLELATLQLQIAERVDARIAQSALRVWNSRVIINSQATQVNVLRIMRNTWTTWNDNLRCQALMRTINDRVALQALYKWLLAERLALLRRVRNEKLRAAIFSLWRTRSNDFCGSLGHATLRARSAQKRRSAQSIVKKWHTKTKAKLQEEIRAQDFRHHRVSTSVLLAWIFKIRNVHRLEAWAGDARFYVLATGTIKHWQMATATTKRVKRRDAYAAVRRKTKMNVARQLLAKWYEATTRVLEMRRQAEQVLQQHLAIVATTLSDTWHTRVRSVLGMIEAAISFHQQRLLGIHFEALSQEYRSIQLATRRAQEFSLEGMDNAVVGLLRRLNWQLFQIKRQQETAASLAERNRRKHYRNMIRYWAEKVAARRGQPPPRSILRHSVRPTLGHGDDGDRDLDRSFLAARAEDWTPFPDINGTQMPARQDERDDALPRSTAGLPLYLRTPSRRIGKGTSRAQAEPMTPATTRITPFMSRLRAQYVGGSRVRSALGDFASTLADDGGLSADVIGEVPETNSPSRLPSRSD